MTVFRVIKRRGAHAAREFPLESDQNSAPKSRVRASWPMWHIDSIFPQRSQAKSWSARDAMPCRIAREMRRLSH
jgi:hypothetical protein